MLWILQIPTIVMLAFYLFMVSQLNVEQEKNEIAVFKSRGASSGQIFAIYAVEAGVLGLVTFIAAPFIGMLLCSFLGVSNGFLEFVNRTGLSVKLSLDAFIYALLAVVIFFITTMLPIIPASKLSIVKYKQSKARVVKMSLWEKLCIDVILLGGSLVWYFFTARSIKRLFADGTYVSDGTINPLYFVFSTMFIMGAGASLYKSLPLRSPACLLYRKTFLDSPAVHRDNLRSTLTGRQGALPHAVPVRDLRAWNILSEYSPGDKQQQIRPHLLLQRSPT